MAGAIQVRLPREPRRFGIHSLRFVAVMVAITATAPATLASTRHVPDDCTTIQAAIDSSAVGDTVLVRAGTYSGLGNRDIDYHGKDLVVRGEGTAGDVVIDCENLGRGFFFNNSETAAARLENVTVTRGTGNYASYFTGCGGGVFCALASPSLQDCSFIDCSTAQKGGGAYLICSDSALERCRFSGNSGWQGGGLTIECGAFTVTDCVFTGNRGESGGGVCMEGIGSNRLTGCTIAANDAWSGGGVYTGSFPVYLDRCVIWGNCCSSSYGDEVYVGLVELSCSVVDSSGFYETHPASYDANCIFTSPDFCSPAQCGTHTSGDWTVFDTSPCLPQNNACGELIGAFGQGCPAPPAPAACCLPDGSCFMVMEATCDAAGGAWQGEGSVCTPNPCQPTPVERMSWGRVKDIYRGEGR